ncbi:hypothetical protein BU16DRAFT_548867 [Lophium mytilinum]|uniref:Dienelactone hydrolase domain-containing protein n=1 Tax=Lophium mytilinum TaxID=390894 RepID=A0A6A6R1P6_9PEZI|nr:hypothetical protein BU16DRAFT_548867 [Lophium mytilinum]
MSCPDCFRGGQAKGEPKGALTTLYGVTTYVALPPSSTTSKSTILFITDAFGLKLVNNKLLADDYALRTGHRVVIPDIIPGHGVEPAVIAHMDNVMKPVKWWDILGQLSRIWSVANAARHFVPFMLKASPDKAHIFKSELEYARKLKADIPPGGKLGVCGFCWGGYGSTNLCVEPAVEGGSEQLIDAQFCAHPSALKGPEQVVAAITTYKVPYSLAHAENDFNWSTAKMDTAEAELKQKYNATGNGENGYNYEFITYKGCAHGFAARARPGTADVQGADDAKEQAIKWFSKWL